MKGVLSGKRQWCYLIFMNFFNLDRKKVLLLLGLIGIILVGINMQRNPGESLTLLRPFYFLSGAIQNTYFSFTSGVRGTTALYLDLIDIKKANRQLLKENAELRAQLGSMTELKLENERFSDLLKFKQKSNMKLLAAKVVARDLVPDHSTIMINRGSSHGVKRNMAAITVGGAVGYVIQPQLHTSQILLLTDRYASIDSIVQRSRARGIIEGKGKDLCRLGYLQRGDDVKVGDLVVTSGLDNIFPKGFPIGSVSAAQPSRFGMSQEVTVNPSINPFTLEEVFIVLNAHHEDFSPKVTASDSPPSTEVSKQ